jgi:hypothetical protein
MRKVAWIVAVALVLFTGVVGLINAPMEFGGAQNKLQLSVTTGVFIYGVLGVIGGVGLWLRRRWSVPVVAAWSVVVTCVASVASFAYSDPTFASGETVVGLVAAAISTAFIGAFCIWAARSATRDQRLPRTAESGHIPSL